MRKLLPLLLAATFPLAASAQWTSQGPFPADTLDGGGNGMHGVATDPDGQVYLQPFNATATISTPSGDQLTRQLFVYNADGSLDETITYLTNEDGTPGDTLGGFTFVNGTGALAWEGKSGRGLATGPDGDIYVSQFATLYRLDYETNRVKAQYTYSSGLPSSALTAASVDNNGTVTVRAVFPGESAFQLGPDLSEIGDAYATSNFSRTILASPDGNTIYATDYENPYTIVYQRADEFSPYDSVGVTMRGMRVESAAINPMTGNYWFSAGNSTDNPVNQDPDATRMWYSHTWYAFTPESLMDENPAPVDSLSWYECDYDNDDPTTADIDEGFFCYVDGGLIPGKPRGIAFSPDGNTAYVVLFSQVNAAASYTRLDTAAEPTPGASVGQLAQNRPNPFSGRTTIRFSLERAADVSVRVIDTMGREVATLAEGARAAGDHAVEFDATGLAAGVYVYLLDVEGQVTSRQMMVVR